MKIVNVVCAPGRTGFFFDDQKAIKSGAKSDGAAYIGQPVTSGFKSIRQAGESISVMLVLEDGQSHGATVQLFSTPVQAAVTHCSWLRTSSRLSINTSNLLW